MKVSHGAKPQTRRRRTRRLWSRPRRTLIPREYLHLPTRETLTYAEAQKFVDVETDGEIHRLNICEPLELVSHAISDENATCERIVTASVSTRHDVSLSSLYIDDSCSMSAISKLPLPVFKVLDGVEPVKSLYKRQVSYFRNIEKTPEELNEEVEYDMDEEDMAWLRKLNELRRQDKLVPLAYDSFEAVIDRLEKEAHLLTVTGSNEFKAPGTTCEICMDSECHNMNGILVCDMCNMAVHQDCYGVPFLPEGQWLCKKCLKSPNTSLNCCLCPMKDGPLKQTDDGRWAHVLCAVWIPEVGFGSAIYLEPVDKIDRVPVSRFQLKCEICKIQGSGTCIKCQAPNCDSSFHATCAMRGGLFMKMEAVPENGSRMNYRKTFFCNHHRPIEATLYLPGASAGIGADDDASRCSVSGSNSKTSNRSKSKKSKKSVAEQLPCQPVMPVPTIPSKRLIAIADHLNVRDKRQLIARVYSYWLLKRQSKNGCPLIQRLHSTLTAHHILQSKDLLGHGADENELKLSKKLRQDLEKVRLLLELIRKREKLKYEHIKLQETIVNLKLQPFTVLLRRTLDQLQAKDPLGIFAFPVPVSEVPDYLDCISHPMDFSTMRDKVEGHVYRTVDDFEADFHLIVNNCMTYNQKGSGLYKMALKLKEQGNVIIAAARRMSERADYCMETGLHKTDAGLLDGSLTVSNHLKALRSSEAACDEDGLEVKLKELLKCLDVLQVVRSVQNAHLAKRLKKDIATCRRKLTLCRQDQENSNATNDQLHHSVDQRMKGRTRNCIRGRLKSADSLLEESQKSSHTEEKCNSTVTVGPFCTTATLAHDDYKRQHIHTRQDVSNSKSEGKLPQVDAALGLPMSPSKGASDIKAVTDLNVCVTFPMKMNGQFINSSYQSDCSAITTRSASRRRLSFASQETDSSPSKQGVKRQLSMPSNTSSHQSRQRTCGRFHMIAQPVFTVDSTENDSSYESSYSMLSDSELSKCNSPDSQNGGPIFTVAKKKSRSSCSVEAFDTKTPLHPNDVVWAKSKGYPWYPAVIIDPNASVENDCSKVLPPSEVLALQPVCQEPIYLIRFFDKRQNWQWLPRNKLEPLGVSGALDTTRMSEVKQCKLRRDVKRAYDEAYSIMPTNQTSFAKPS